MTGINKTIQLLFILITSNLFSQQSFNFDFFEKIEFEKVLISHYRINNKKSSAPPSSLFSDTKEEVSDVTVKKIGKRELTKKEFCGIYNLLENNLNFTHILDPNNNITIDFYKDNEIYQNIRVSSFSKNITLHKIGCENILDVNEAEIYPCLFLGNMNPKLEKYINKLLSKIEKN